MTVHLADLRTRYVAAQLAGDRAAALGVIDEALASGLPAPDLEVQLVGGAQREIGMLWERNEIGIADEHTATAISQYALAHLYRHHARAPRNGRTVTVACVQGETHDMGARIATDILDGAGFTVRFLGADVPTDDLVRTLSRLPCDAVALSATLSMHFATLVRTIERVRAEVSPTLPVLLGGYTTVAPDVKDPHVYFVHGDAHALVQTVSAILGVAP